MVGTVLVAVLGLMLIALQRRFEQGDLDRAVALVLNIRPGASWSVARELDARSGQARPQCVPRIVSSFAGTVEVSCTAGPGGAYQFEVDLVAKSVQPIGEPAAELLRAVEEKSAAPDGG